MKFLLDENLGVKVQQFLQKSGHECLRTSSIVGQGMSDRTVYEYCLRSNCSLITRDHHFLNQVRFPLRENFGIVFVRHGNLKTSEEIQLLRNFLDVLKTSPLNGKLVVLSRSGISFRPTE